MSETLTISLIWFAIWVKVNLFSQTNVNLPIDVGGVMHAGSLKHH